MSSCLESPSTGVGRKIVQPVTGNVICLRVEIEHINEVNANLHRARVATV
ncbi:MAG: hypothetical protein P4L50_16515 [Anaerolineaceae bacterium]|nr:hypothetical protein [Anaerolineaceae bacterium]